MNELLLSLGWQKSGGCSACGIQNFVSPQYGDVVVKVKKAINGYKIVRAGKVIVPFMPANTLKDKLNEL